MSDRKKMYFNDYDLNVSRGADPKKTKQDIIDRHEFFHNSLFELVNAHLVPDEHDDLIAAGNQLLEFLNENLTYLNANT